MSFLKQYQIEQIEKGLIHDDSQLKKIYREKKAPYDTQDISISVKENYLKEGWEVIKELKQKLRIQKQKSHDRKFEDEIWCQFYELGFRHLSYGRDFRLPFGKGEKDDKQIDILAIRDEAIFIIECKSSQQPNRAKSYKEDIDALKFRLDGFKKALYEIIGRQSKVKYILATKNLRLESGSSNSNHLKETNSYHYSENTFQYVNNLIKNYKNAAYYQFLGLMFKGIKINNNPIEIPAVKGAMGCEQYYMFSIEPEKLLKIGFILHRAKANMEEFPSYQRLLQPNRLKGITKFIDDGGYFPNAIIINFQSTKNTRLIFEPSSSSDDTKAKHGLLKIPNAYAIAYIMDGQHRLYGYAGSNYKENNTIPIVAFDNLKPKKQLEIFMDINQNQKAVSADLKGDLEEDLYWDSERIDFRLKALKSSIIKTLSNNDKSSLWGKISIGEERTKLQFKPFTNALRDSGLLPKATSNKYTEHTDYCLYDTCNHNHQEEMEKAKKAISSLLMLCYNFVEQEYPNMFDKPEFIISNRGTYAFITCIGSLNQFLIKTKKLEKNSTSQDRFDKLEMYLNHLLSELNNLDDNEKNSQLALLGAGADTKWLRFFQSIINNKYQDFEPDELIDWKERQDDELQETGRRYGIAIEKYMKNKIIETLKVLYGDGWELEINSIKRACLDRAEKERERIYKEQKKNERIEWTEMFFISDYKTIVSNHWSKSEGLKEKKLEPFQKIFAIDTGDGIGNKNSASKWISQFNSYRNLWAHEGTKEKRLNKEEVYFLESIHTQLKLS